MRGSGSRGARRDGRSRRRIVALDADARRRRRSTAGTRPGTTADGTTPDPPERTRAPDRPVPILPIARGGLAFAKVEVSAPPVHAERPSDRDHPLVRRPSSLRASIAASGRRLTGPTSAGRPALPRLAASLLAPARSSPGWRLPPRRPRRPPLPRRPRPPPPAAATILEGIDVSHWQGAINWSKVAAAGKKFAIIKASEDVDFVDPTVPGQPRRAQGGRDLDRRLPLRPAGRHRQRRGQRSRPLRRHGPARRPRPRAGPRPRGQRRPERPGAPGLGHRVAEPGLGRERASGR